jgi:hypothetical protein
MDQDTQGDNTVFQTVFAVIKCNIIHVHFDFNHFRRATL